MTAAIRRNGACALLAVAGAATLAWLGLYGFAWNDYEVEALPAVHALLAGHVASFLALAPAYGGSLLMRAPFALSAGLFGGGDLAVYRALALPCLLASAALGVFLLDGMRRRGGSRLARGAVLGLCVANPLALRALELGHPEELLGASLCVAAVLTAARQRPLAAGLLLGLAVANKQWAVVAAGPVLLALAPGLRLRSLASALAGSLALLGPFVLSGAGGLSNAAVAAATAPSTIFQPWQVFWFAGRHGALVHGLFGDPKPGYRVPPAWVGGVSHPLIVLAGAAIAAALWLRRARAAERERRAVTAAAVGRARGARRVGHAVGALTRTPALPVREALLALALALLLRCVLDTWDTVYYPLPFVFALLAWEACAPAGGVPVWALLATVLAWASFGWLPGRASADVQAAAFLAWTLPAATLLSFGVFASDSHGAGRARLAGLRLRLATSPVRLRRRPSAPWAAP